MWVHLGVKAIPVVHRVAQFGPIQLDLLAAGIALAENVIKQDDILNSACNDSCKSQPVSNTPCFENGFHKGGVQQKWKGNASNTIDCCKW